MASGKRIRRNVYRTGGSFSFVHAVAFYSRILVETIVPVEDTACDVKGDVMLRSRFRADTIPALRLTRLSKGVDGAEASGERVKYVNTPCK